MCALEFPGIETDIWQPFKDAGNVQVLAVNADIMGRDDAETIQAFADQTQITFPVGTELSTSYLELRQSVTSISPYPLDVIIDPDGNIAYVSGEYDPDAMVEIMNALVR